MKFPGVVAVLRVVPSGLVLHIGITSCTFPPWTEKSKKNGYEISICLSLKCAITQLLARVGLHGNVFLSSVCHK